MNAKLTLRAVLLGSIFAAASLLPVSAQVLTVSSGSDVLLSTASFTENGSGEATLANPSGLTSNKLPAMFAPYIDWSGGGLYNQSAAGNVWVSANNLVLGDPFVTYSVAFQNTSTTSQTFTTTITEPFTSTDFEPALVAANFLGALDNGNASGGVTATATETGLLYPTNLGSPLTITFLNAGTLDSSTNPTFNLATANYPSLLTSNVSGDFDQIGVSVTVTLAPGAFVALTGRVDAEPFNAASVPEPSSIAFFALGAVVLAGMVLRRRKLA